MASCSSCFNAFELLILTRAGWVGYYYRPQLSWGKVIFSEACVNNSVHGGECMVLFGGVHGFIQGGVHGFIRGHAWFYSGGVHGFIWGGMRGFIRGGGGMCGFIQGAMHGFIQQGGHAWFYSAGVRGFIQRGMCVALFRGGMCGFFSFSGYNEIRSMSGRYASYWNAFLLTNQVAGCRALVSQPSLLLMTINMAVICLH